MDGRRIRKIFRNLKKCFITALVFALMLNNIVCAVAVSDNDGSAFITKAEFDSLKNNFQSQINQYNTSIDNKIDNAIATYIAEITVAKKIEQTSLINKLSSQHFTKDFNYFGKSTTIGDYYKYWSWYSFTFGLDATNAGSSSKYGIGLRGGTAVLNPEEKTSGSTQSNYLICGKSAYDNTLYVPSYGVTSYNYYYFLNMCSYYGSAGPDGCYTGSLTITGSLGSNTDFGIRYYTGGFLQVASYYQGVSSAFSVYPMDTTWTTYDANALPGNAMDSTAKCHYIRNNEIMNLGVTDGTFNGTNDSENLYWVGGGGRQHGSGTVTLTMTKYKRKYQEQNYINFINDIVSQTVLTKVYYYNGLPIFKATDTGVVTLKIKPINTSGHSTYVAICDEPFENVNVGTGGIDVDNDGCSFTDWNMASDTEYEIKFNVKKDTTYWIKACPSGDDSQTTFTTTSIILEKSN